MYIKFTIIVIIFVCIFYETLSGGAKRTYSLKLKLNFHSPDVCGKKYDLLFQWNFTLQKRTNEFLIVCYSFIWWATLLTTSSYKPYRTYLSGIIIFAPIRSQKNKFNMSLLSWGCHPPSKFHKFYAIMISDEEKNERQKVHKFG